MQGVGERGVPDDSVKAMLRRIAAEGLGSLLLAATVIGSGIMAEKLANGNLAVALIANTGATVAVLATLIAVFAPVSGAHFNPAVSLVQALRGELTWKEFSAYACIQIVGCCLGAVLAHAMFDLPLLQTSLHARTGLSQWLSECVATFGLLLVVLQIRRSEDAPWMVSAWIGGGMVGRRLLVHRLDLLRQSRHYLARSLSNTFAGIAPSHVLPFVAAQLLGALLALPVARLLRVPRMDAAT